jgi:hypothetical protein
VQDGASRPGFVRILGMLAVMVSLAAHLRADGSIDDFSVDQGPVTIVMEIAPTTSAITSHAATASPFGQRTLRIDSDDAVAGDITMEVSGGSVHFTRPEGTTALLQVWWDGVDGNDVFSATGPSVDVTAGGSLNAFRVQTDSATPDTGVVRVVVWSDTTNASTSVFSIPSGGGTRDLRFDEFHATHGAGADFSSVKAVHLSTYATTGGWTASFSSLTTVALPVPEGQFTSALFRISTAGDHGDGSSVSNVAVAADGSGQALVVWGEFSKIHPEDDQGQLEIWGQLVDAMTGAAIGGAIRVSEMGDDLTGFTYTINNPDVAYNAVDDEYLVVWRGDDDSVGDGENEIWGQRIDASTGAAIGGDFRISEMGVNGDTSSFVDHPAVAWDAANNRYLVVWEGNDLTLDTEIFGRVVSNTGVSLTGDVQLSTTGTSGDIFRRASDSDVEFDTVNNRYLVVWQGDPQTVDNEIEIYGQFVNPDGTEAGSDFRISSLGDSSDVYWAAAPSVAFNPDAEEFLIAFHGDHTDPGDGRNEIFIQRIDADPATGSVLVGGNVRITDCGPASSDVQGAFYPDAAYDEATGTYVVVYTSDHEIDNDNEIRAQRLDAGGGLIGQTNFRVSEMGPLGSNMYTAAYPAVAWSDALALMVWTGDEDVTDVTTSVENEVWGRILEIVAPSAGQSVISASPETIAADGSATSTITVQVKSFSGADMTSGGATVELATTLGTLGSVTDNSDGTYTATLTAGTATGVATITGALNGDAITDTALVTFAAGPVSAPQSTISAAPGSIVADGTSTATVTLQAKDANGNELDAGGAAVVFFTTAGTIGAANDEGDGTYTAQLTSSTSLETATVTATIDGNAVTDDAAVAFVAGPAVSLQVEAPASATGNLEFVVTVTARDAMGHVASGYTGTVAVTSTATSAVLPADHTFSAPDAGVHAFTVVLNTAGDITVTATDTATSSITGSDVVSVKGNTTTGLTTSVNPSLVGQSVTFTATVTSPTEGTISGTVTFKNGTTAIGAAIVANGTAAFTTSSLPAGSHSITAHYAGSTTFNGSASSAVNQVVDLSGFGPPALATASATSTSQISVSWTAVEGATTYQVWRSSGGSPFGLVATRTVTIYVDSGLAPNTTYVYKLIARTATQASGFSAPDAATTVLFTDPVLSSGMTPVAAHLTELRTAVNAVRAAAGRSAAVFTDAAITAGSTAIRRLHIVELRTALDEARADLGLPVLSYTDTAITAGATQVKAAHFVQLRSGTQ